MKTVTKFLTLGLMLAAFGAASVTANFAQTPEECEKIYQDFLGGRKGPDKAKFEAAVAAGESYLSKCKDLPDNKEVFDYVTKQLPKVKQAIIDFDKGERIKAFNDAVTKKDWASAFNVGKQIINDNPDDVDIPLVLASIGFDNSVANPPVDTFNGDTISMAKLALQKMEQGKGSGTGSFGAFAYVYKTAACADGKTNANGWMNYTIGNIMYYRMNQKKEALPYLYKATQVGCETKDKIAGIYRTIGNYYIDEFKRIETEKNEAYKLIDGKPTTEPGFAENEKKYKDLVALQKGYMERTMDAIARAYKVAVNAKESAAYQTAQLNLAKQFYGFRNGQTPTVPFDTWLQQVNAKPFPDPTSTVEPIVEAEPTTAPTAMTTAPETPAASGTDTRTRTVNTPATGTAKTSTSTTAAKTTATPTTTAAKSATTTTKAPAKPAPKKKGTR